jgi:hypothetical protein
MKVKNWKETAKERRTWRDLAEKVKTHKGLYCQMMMMIIISFFMSVPPSVCPSVRMEQLGFH